MRFNLIYPRNECRQFQKWRDLINSCGFSMRYSWGYHGEIVYRNLYSDLIWMYYIDLRLWRHCNGRRFCELCNSEHVLRHKTFGGVQKITHDSKMIRFISSESNHIPSIHVIIDFRITDQIIQIIYNPCFFSVE